MKKRILGMSLTVSMLMSLIVSPVTHADVLDSTMTGKIINIGSYSGNPMQYTIAGSRDVDGDGIEELMCYSTKQLFCKELSADGTANWKTSSLRKWLNSNDNEVEWDSGNIPSYSSQNGFLTNFSDNEKQIIVPETHKSLIAESLPHDGGKNTIGWSTAWPGVYTDAVGARDINTAYYVMTTDYVFIPSIEDMYLYNMTPFGDFFSYDAACLSAAGEAASNERAWIRDGAAADTARFAWIDTGRCDISARTVSAKYGIRPCMYIKSGLNITGQGTPESPYEIVYPFDIKSVDMQMNEMPVSELTDGTVEFLATFTAEADKILDLYAVRYEKLDGKITAADMQKQSIVTGAGTQNASVFMDIENADNSYVKVFMLDENQRAMANAAVFGREPTFSADEIQSENNFAVQSSVYMKDISIYGEEKNSQFAVVNVVVSKLNQQNETAVIYADCKNVLNNGTFAFNFTAGRSFFTEDTVGGVYTATLYSSYADRPLTVSIGIASENLYEDTIAAIPDYDEETIRKILSNDSGYVLEYSAMQGKGLYLEELEDQQVLNEVSAAVKTGAPAQGYTKDNFTHIFNRIVSETILKNADDTEKKYAVLDNDRYSEILGSKPCLSMESYSILKTANNAALFENELLLSDFQQAVIITAANSAENASDLKAVIEENRQLIGIVFPDVYEKLSGTQLKKLYDDMLKGNFVSYAQIKSAFDAAYNTVKTAAVVSGGGSSGSNSKGTVVPAASVQTVQPVTAAPEEVYFADIENLTWGKDEIISLAKRKVINGMTGTLFEPDGKITREQFCQMAAAAFGIEVSEKTTGFKDVVDGAWYINAVAAMTNNGYVSGIDHDTFGIGTNITRQDIAAILYRILKDKMTVEFEAEFTDAEEISEYAREAVNTLSAYKILSGYEDGSFKAKQEVTRREAALMIYRAAELK